MSEDQIIHPKVFISYSWAVQDWVKKLADKLRQDGVDAITDFYDLKPGNDIHAFMEQQVTDPSMDHVLIVCDKTYAEKADRRIGGVGNETAIITPEVYGKTNQTKIIPVVFEKNGIGDPFCPAYLKSRYYIDFSDTNQFEEKYEELLREIYKKPLHKKPELGKMPEWLNNESVELLAVKNNVRDIKSLAESNLGRQTGLLKSSVNYYVEAIKKYTFHGDDIATALPALIDQSKQIRDLFLDTCRGLIDNGTNIADSFVSFFETLYNQLHDATNDASITDAIIEFRDFVIWEFFIDLTALLLYYERYKELHEVLAHSYYLRSSPKANIYKYTFYTAFWHSFSIIDKVCKPKSKNPNLFSLESQILVNRTSEPELTIDSIANADIILYQLSSIVIPQNKEIAKYHIGYWFPRSYVYFREKQPFWDKMQSRRYCLKIAPLFGVTTLAELLSIVEYSNIYSNMRYSGDCDYAPGILSNIRPDQIGTLP